MWVRVLTWKGKHLTGLLENVPEIVHDLHHGDRVDVDEDQIFDYLYGKSDGTREGYETESVLRKIQRRQGASH